MNRLVTRLRLRRRRASTDLSKLPTALPGHKWLAIEVPEDVAERYLLADNNDPAFARRVRVALLHIVRAWEHSED